MPIWIVSCQILQASPCLRFNKEGSLLAVTTNDNGIKSLENFDGVRLLCMLENRVFEGTRIPPEVVSTKVLCCPHLELNTCVPKLRHLTTIVLFVGSNNKCHGYYGKHGYSTSCSDRMVRKGSSCCINFYYRESHST